MNYKVLFVTTLTVTAALNARHYSHGFSLEEGDNAVTITIDTGKKVSADDINITHKKQHVVVKVDGLDHTLNLDLEAAQGSLAVSMRTQIKQEETGEHAFRSFEGSSYTQQVIPARVDLTQTSADYKGTKLVLSIPLLPEDQGKKIHVTVSDDSEETALTSAPAVKKARKLKHVIDEK